MQTELIFPLHGQLPSSSSLQQNQNLQGEAVTFKKLHIQVLHTLC